MFISFHCSFQFTQRLVLLVLFFLFFYLEDVHSFFMMVCKCPFFIRLVIILKSCIKMNFVSWYSYLVGSFSVSFFSFGDFICITFRDNIYRYKIFIFITKCCFKGIFRFFNWGIYINDFFRVIVFFNIVV